MFNPDHLHIAIASDENYARFVASLIASVQDNNSSFRQITFHLLSNKITADSLQKIRNILDYDVSSLKIYDISNLQIQLGVTVPPTIALTSYARLFMSRIIDSNISKIIYLDTDIIVINDLYDLWTTALFNNYLGGCLDIFEGTASKINIGLDENEPYINSGVLLINLDVWRKEKIDTQFMTFLLEHNGHVHHHDQGIINAVCRKRIMLLHPMYNLHSSTFSHPYNLIKKITNPYYSKEDFQQAHSTPAIIHFTEGFYNRPWKQNCNHPFKDAYLKYSSQTAWKDYPLLPDNRSIAVKVLSYSFLKFPYYIYRSISAIIIFIYTLIKK